MPTDGDFSKFIFSNKSNKENFEQDDIGDLHIGITSSKSNVYDFDINGLKRNSHTWLQTPSIVIRLEEINLKSSDNILRPNGFAAKWDLALENKFASQKWNKSNYHEQNFNCLDFVTEHLLDFDFFHSQMETLSFSKNEIKNFSHSDLNKLFFKKKLSHDLIEPEFVKCLKYLNLIILLYENKFIEEQLNENFNC